MTRRELGSLVSGAILSSALPEGAAAQQAATLASTWLNFAEMQTRKSAGGGEIRAFVNGKLATGERLECHETTLPAGQMPHASHHHLHSEMVLVREGTVEVAVGGKSKTISAGGAVFIASNEEHGLTNVGASPATYFIVAIGPTAGS